MALRRERYQALAEFRYALRHFLAVSEGLCDAAGVTSTQYQMMQMIASRPELLTMKAIAEQLLLKHHSAVQLTDRLVDKGLLERVSSSGDGRVVFVRMTPAGEALFDKLASKHLAAMVVHEPLISKAIRNVRMAVRQR
jgi:DNA-binding MarR family transcriptional regulator